MRRGMGVGLLLLVFGVAFISSARQYDFGTLASPGPAMVPVSLSILLLALQAVDLGVALLGRRGTGGSGAGDAPRPREAKAGDGRTIFVLTTAGGFALTYLVGLPAAAGAYAAVSSRLLGLRAWWKSLAFGICLGVLVHYFGSVFQIAFPGGWLTGLIWG